MTRMLILAAALSVSATAAEEKSLACRDCPAMVPVAGGSFEMGETVDYGYGPMDGPRHTVVIPPFAVAPTEVTRAQYARFLRSSGYRPRSGACNVYTKANPEWHLDPAASWKKPGFAQAENHPVVCVTWADASAYVDWINTRTGRHYRLLSEAEWEFLAAQGGLDPVDHTRANMGTEPCCGGRTEGPDVWLHTAPVGSFPADRFGIHDIRGNVWEWQADCYHPDYSGAPVNGQARITGCMFPEHRAIRGGSFGDAAYNYKPTFRLRGPVSEGYFTVGFRLAADTTDGTPRR